MADDSIERRRFLLGAGTAVAAGLATELPTKVEAQSAQPVAVAPERDAMLVLTVTEADFIAAAVDTIIPADELSPSGSECGIITFIDRQLASAWGGGAKMYRGGPSMPDPARVFPGRRCRNQRMVTQNLRQGVRPSFTCRSRIRLEDNRAGQGGVRGLFLARLFRSASEHNYAGLLFRPDPWRQPRQGVVENARFPRSAGHLCGENRRVSRQTLFGPTPVDCGL
jgi:hypothetical protein